MQRRKAIERIVNPTYLKDPDYLVFVEDYCPQTGEMYPVEVGFAYKYKKGGGLRTTYYDDPRINQLRYEADTAYHKPFQREEADAKTFKAEAKPKVARVAAPKMRM